MKTIAVTIDEPTLRALDDLAAGGPSRSHFVREALHAWLREEKRRRDEAREAAVIARNADRLNRQLGALVADQDEQ